MPADEVLVVTIAWSGNCELAQREPRLARVLPDAVYWKPVLAGRDDIRWESWAQLYVSMSPWRPHPALSASMGAGRSPA
jgi:hypothetical protein